jgi:hypothetical protein
MTLEPCPIGIHSAGAFYFMSRLAQAKQATKQTLGYLMTQSLLPLLWVPSHSASWKLGHEGTHIRQVSGSIPSSTVFALPDVFPSYTLAAVNKCWIVVACNNYFCLSFISLRFVLPFIRLITLTIRHYTILTQ